VGPQRTKRRFDTIRSTPEHSSFSGIGVA